MHTQRIVLGLAKPELLDLHAVVDIASRVRSDRLIRCVGPLAINDIFVPVFWF
jgi:hypothetical protein